MDGHEDGPHRILFSSTEMEGYGRRWTCERVNGAFERIRGRIVRSRTPSTPFAKAAPEVAAYAVKIRRCPRAGWVLDGAS